MWYSPEPSVTAGCAKLVLTLVADTFAPDTVAPEGSVTLPVMAPVT